MTAEIGDNSGKRLLSFIERVEKLEEERSSISSDIKEVFSEAKGTGFDVKTMKKIIRLRKMNAEKRKEEEALLQTYASAVQLDLF